MRIITIEGLHVLAQAGRIAESSLRLPGVVSARVRVAKPQVFADCATVSVEVQVQHSKQDGP